MLWLSLDGAVGRCGFVAVRATAAAVRRAVRVLALLVVPVFFSVRDLPVRNLRTSLPCQVMRFDVRRFTVARSRRSHLSLGILLALNLAISHLRAIRATLRLSCWSRIDLAGGVVRLRCRILLHAANCVARWGCRRGGWNWKESEW